MISRRIVGQVARIIPPSAAGSDVPPLFFLFFSSASLLSPSPDLSIPIVSEETSRKGRELVLLTRPSWIESTLTGKWGWGFSGNSSRHAGELYTASLNLIPERLWSRWASLNTYPLIYMSPCSSRSCSTFSIGYGRDRASREAGTYLPRPGIACQITSRGSVCLCGEGYKQIDGGLDALLPPPRSELPSTTVVVVAAAPRRRAGSSDGRDSVGIKSY